MKKFAAIISLSALMLAACQQEAPIADTNETQSKTVTGSVQVVAAPLTEEVTGSVQVVAPDDAAASQVDAGMNDATPVDVVAPAEVRTPDTLVENEVPAVEVIEP